MNIEHIIQRRCVHWFKTQYWRYAGLLFAVPNGQKRTRWQQQQASEEGMTAGVADLLLLMPGQGYHGLCIEMKKPRIVEDGEEVCKRGYQSKEQREWQKAVEAQGYKYAVCRSEDEFHKLIEGYVNG